MSKFNFELDAISRKDIGKGASRRLRRLENLVPAVIYGGNTDATSISFKENELKNAMQHEAFYSQILTLKIDGKAEKAVIKDVQRHPAKPIVLHLDFQRVSAKEKITMRVPLHFINEDTAPGVKIDNGIISHVQTDLELKCLPSNLPEFISVDIGELGMDQAIHMSEVTLPEGVEFAHPIDEDHDSPVVTIHAPRAVIADEELDAAADAAEGEEGAEAEDKKDESSDK